MALLDKELPVGWEGSALSGLIINRTVGEDTAIVSADGNYDITAEIVKLNGYSPYCDPHYAEPGQVVEVKTMRRLKAKADFDAQLTKAVEWCNHSLGCEPLTEAEKCVLATLVRKHGGQSA